MNYDSTQLEPAFRPQVHRDETILADVEENLSEAVSLDLPLSDEDLDDLEAFLGALTRSNLFGVAAMVPDEVPSGLEIPLP
jgi:hypothetical protein